MPWNFAHLQQRENQHLNNAKKRAFCTGQNLCLQCKTPYFPKFIAGVRHSVRWFLCFSPLRSHIGGFPKIFQLSLFVQFPGSTVLGVFHLESQTGKFVANTVARCPIFGRLGLLARFEQKIHRAAESFFPALV